MFIGPNDLSASFGHIGNWGHPEVQAAIEDAVKRLKKIGKPAGILTPNEEEAKKFIQWGYTFVAVGADLGLLAKNADALAKRFKPYEDAMRAMTWQSRPPRQFHVPARRAAAGALRRAMAGAGGARLHRRRGRTIATPVWAGTTTFGGLDHASAAGRLAARPCASPI